MSAAGAKAERPDAASGAPTPGEAAGGLVGGGEGLATQLRGMSYEEGAAALAPQPEGATAGRAGTKTAAPTEKPSGTLWATDAEGKALPPSLADIRQGGLNDCYLFAAMAAIVNADASRIVNAIQDHGDGTYTVTFKGIGLFKSATQTVSADFEVGRHGSVTSTKALWPLIIEKAYAQEKGGTDAIGGPQGGNPGAAVDDLTNDGASRFDPHDKTADWIIAKLKKAKDGKAPVTVLAPKGEGASEKKVALTGRITGLIFWHAYAVVDVDVEGKRLKLFNPHGRNHPNGTGWLDIEDFRSFFIEVNVND